MCWKIIEQPDIKQASRREGLTWGWSGPRASSLMDRERISVDHFSISQLAHGLQQASCVVHGGGHLLVLRAQLAALDVIRSGIQVLSPLVQPPTQQRHRLPQDVAVEWQGFFRRPLRGPSHYFMDVLVLSVSGGQSKPASASSLLTTSKSVCAMKLWLMISQSRAQAIPGRLIGGQDAQQAAGLAEGRAGHAQQLGCCSPLKGAWEEGQQQQGMQELVWQGAHNVPDAPAQHTIGGLEEQMEGGRKGKVYLSKG
ncbi:MAG: hypothetical protein FRX49_04308 [Trebouxia sp. A1-2]|nr:MAG: hypothetical protein FRX49_04308 [Trebouxia sp. A1-2]